MNFEKHSAYIEATDFVSILNCLKADKVSLKNLPGFHDKYDASSPQWPDLVQAPHPRMGAEAAV